MNAYISYICNDNYLAGVIALIKSLKYHKCNNDIIIMITDEVSENSINELTKLNVLIKMIDKIIYTGKLKNKIIDRYGKNNTSWMMFTKLNIWKFTEYNKNFN